MKAMQYSLLCKDNITKLSKSEPRRRVRITAYNILSQPAGFKGDRNNIKSPLDCFNITFDHNIVRIILNNTNVNIIEIFNKYLSSRDARPTDELELRCLIRLLSYLGANESGRQNFKILWDQDGLEVEIFIESMNFQRF